MTRKKTTAKLHHYVPQGYLRGFATDQERIRVVPLDRSRQPYTPSVKNVAAQNHFHTVSELDEPDAFEKMLSGVEGRALGIIRGFTNGGFPLSEENRWTLAYYMALQSMRGPDARRTTEYLCAAVARLKVGAGGRRHVGAWTCANLGITPTPEQENRIWNEATQSGGSPIRLSNMAHIKHAVETAIELTPYLALRPWVLVRFIQRSLITSDAPVSLVPRPDDDPWEGVGFATAWSVTFPLTRKFGLLMSDPMAMLEGFGVDETRAQKLRAMVLAGRIDRIESGSTALEKLFNTSTAESAKEYVFHHPEDERFLPADLPEPDLINIKTEGGLVDMEFDGEPLFAPGGAGPTSPAERLSKPIG